MSYYTHDGGWHDFPTRREAEEDARWDDFVYAERESFDAHYGPEIDDDVRQISVSGIVQAFELPEPIAEQLALWGGL